jgi:hypothetical protein
MGLELVALHDSSNRCISCKPFGNPQGSIQPESLYGILTCFPVNRGNKVLGNVSLLAPVVDEVVWLGVIVQ